MFGNAIGGRYNELSAIWRGFALTVLGAVCVAAQAGQLERLRVKNLKEGPGDASRALGIAYRPAPTNEIAAAGELRVAGVWEPVWWETTDALPTVLVDLGFGGRVRDLVINGPGNGLRGAGYVTDAAGLSRPCFWADWNLPFVLPMLPGGGSVRDLAYDAATGQYYMCGFTIDGGGQQFAAFWSGSPAAGFGVFQLLPPLSNNDSTANEITRNAAGDLRIVGWTENVAGDAQACHWDTAGVWARTMLVPLGGGIADAECALNGAAPFNYIAGNAVNVAGDSHPVLWPQFNGWNPIDLTVPSATDDGAVEVILQTGGALYSLGEVTDAAGINTAFGWQVDAGGLTVIGDLNARVMTAGALRLEKAMDAVLRPEAFGETIVLAGVAEDTNGTVQAFVAHDTFPADVNCDGNVDFFDIDPFLLALFDPVAYAATYPGCHLERADVNGDNNVDFFDIDPFLECLFSGCP